MQACFGVWWAARRLNQGRFAWPRELPDAVAPMTLTQAQFDVLVLGLPWQRLEQMQVITRIQVAASRGRQTSNRHMPEWRPEKRLCTMGHELFEETLAADQASLEAQLEALQAQSGAQGETAVVEPRRQPKRQARPEHLQRVEHRHDPQSTTCGCG